MSETCVKKYKYIKKIDYISYKELDHITKIHWQWLALKTSIGYKIIVKLFQLKKRQ